MRTYLQIVIIVSNLTETIIIDDINDVLVLSSPTRSDNSNLNSEISPTSEIYKIYINVNFFIVSSMAESK